MRLPWRRTKDDDVSTEHHQDDRLDEASASLEAAEKSLERVREQRAAGVTIADTLRAIRKENHFREIWHNGLQ